MRVSATEAKNKFGQMLDECQHHPVIIEKAGRRHGVLMSAKQYDQLLAKTPDSSKVSGSQSAGEQFYVEYKDWVDMQNELVAKFGVFGEEYRVW